MRKGIAYATMVALALLAFVSPARASFEIRFTVLVCDKANMEYCTIKTARIFFTGPVESQLPTACLIAGQTKMAQVADLYNPETEAVKVICGH